MPGVGKFKYGSCDLDRASLEIVDVPRLILDVAYLCTKLKTLAPAFSGTLKT